MPTKTKKAAPPVKTVAKKAPAPPPATINGDADEPLIRVAFSVEDLDRLVEALEDWDDSLVYRLKMRLAKHRERWG